MRQLVVVIAALMPPVHIDMTRSALFIPSNTKAIIFVVVAQFLLIYIDEMCVTTATTTRTGTRTRTRATMAITITITGSFAPVGCVCYLTTHN